MNISTGGPHILLFERDQQLTALIMSEFQLAGYECRTARTAVEVFDALARYPVRIVLVDLAQAAATRREFWVALDTQRRGRGIHVLTFHCSNIAGYGPRDPEERSQNTVADLDIDGMLGLMKLVDEVRNRVPSATSTTNTLPRIPRVAPTPLAQAQRTGPLAPVTMNNNGNSFRNSPFAENAANTASPRNASSISSQSTLNTPIASTTTSRTASSSTLASTNGASGTKTVSYTDKIRAVLYPNQRNWSAQGNTPTQAPQEQPQVDMMLDGSQPSQGGTGNATVLQRLANGQTGTEESGLAQLSRLAQANYMTDPPIQYETSRDNNHQQMNNQPIIETRFTQSTFATEQTFINPGTMEYAPPTSPEQLNGNISAQPLRASPIQDIPIERAGGSQAGIEGVRRSDVLTRTNHAQQQAPAALPPLASIATPSAPTTQASGTMPIIQASGTMSASSIPSMTQTPLAYSSKPIENEEDNADNQTGTPAQTVEKPDDSRLEDTGSISAEASEIKQQNNADQGHAGEDADMAQNRNTMLFDIMQSLPPMPPISSQQQTVQAHVLNGRATRSLGSVLLAGHLVPQNRLEVAQNIQRMLRGVDLNYQLGEILLMFKLLTPDQLLAASLVSYGMITTTQVSALGRIRQDLHSIGLEYDLESLLILFRILTPEQLREAKSGMQG